MKRYFNYLCVFIILYLTIILSSYGTTLVGSIEENSIYESIDEFTLRFLDELEGKIEMNISVTSEGFFQSIGFYIKEEGETLYYDLDKIPRFFLNSTKNFTLRKRIPSKFIDGNYIIRVSINHCGGIYKPNPIENCGDFSDLQINLNRGISQASSPQSIQIGEGNIVVSESSGAFGFLNSILGSFSFIVGNNNNIQGYNSLAFGSNLSIIGNNVVGFNLNSSVHTNIESNNSFVITNGNIGINVENPQRSLHISDVMRIEPRMEPPSNPSLGDIYVNNITNSACFFNGNSWLILAGAWCGQITNINSDVAVIQDNTAYSIDNKDFIRIGDIDIDPETNQFITVLPSSQRIYRGELSRFGNSGFIINITEIVSSIHGGFAELHFFNSLDIFNSQNDNELILTESTSNNYTIDSQTFEISFLSGSDFSDDCSNTRALIGIDDTFRTFDVGDYQIISGNNWSFEEVVTCPLGSLGIPQIKLVKND